MEKGGYVVRGGMMNVEKGWHEGMEEGLSVTPAIDKPS